MPLKLYIYIYIVLSPITVAQISFLLPGLISYQDIENFCLSFKPNIQIVESLSELKFVK